MEEIIISPNTHKSMNTVFGFNRDNMASSTSINKNRKSYKSLDPRIILFEEIRKHYKDNRRFMTDILKKEQLKTIANERRLKNISYKYYNMWRKLQNKTIIFSLVRNTIKSKRIYGMSPMRLSRRYSYRPNEKRKVYRIYYGSATFNLHMIVLLFIYMYIIIVLPLNIAFDNTSGYNNMIEYVMLSYLSFDIIMRCIIVIDNNSIMYNAYRYMKPFIVLDVLSSIPIEYILSSRYRHTIQTVLYIPRLIRILICTMNSSIYGRAYSNTIKKIVSSSRLLYIYTSLLSTLIFVHISSCILIRLLSIDTYNNWYVRYVHMMSSMLYNNEMIYDTSNIRLYIVSTYYSVCTITTVGYGDVHPTNICEIISYR